MGYLKVSVSESVSECGLGGGGEGIKSKEDRLNLSGSWHSGHSRAYNPCFCI